MPNRVFRLSAWAAAALALGAPVAHAAAFTAGDIVVYRVGTGAASLTNAATAVFLDEFNQGGNLVQSIGFGSGVLTASGTATSEGQLNRSADGQSLAVTGYAAAIGTAAVASASATAVPRTVATVGVNGTAQQTALGSFSSANNVRTGVAATTGGGTYVAGGTGVAYVHGGAVTQLATTNIRDLDIVGGQLFYSTGSGTTGIYTLGTGLPTTAGQTGTLVAASASPYSFFLADLSSSVAGVDTLYVADDTLGLRKFSKQASGSWSLNNTVAGTSGVRGLAGVVTAGTVQLYATTNTSLLSFTDAGGWNTAISGTGTTLATAAANTVFRGVALAPEMAAPVPEPATYGMALVALLLTGAARRRLR